MLAATNICRRLRRLRDEQGIALISAIGILAVLSGLGVSLVAYSSSNSRSSQLSSKDGVGGHIAEAGYNHAIALLAKDTKTAPDGTATLDGGTVSWKGVRNGDTWTITSTSTVKNPTGAGELHRTVTGKVRIILKMGSGGGGAWNYIYADDVTTCTTLPNNVSIAAPFFVRGDLCMSNNAKITGGPLTVGGTVTVTQSATIGTSTAPLSEVHVGKGCRYGNTGTYVSPCGPEQRVYATTSDATVGTITKPAVDFAKWYAESKPGPLASCTEGSFPGGFDNDTTMNRSLPLPVNLTPAAPYDCVVKSGEHTLGRIAWTGGTAGTLTVMGTIFFDGDIVMTSGTKAVYTGRSVIYASGRIELGNLSQLCGAANCDEAAWDPNQNLIVFVAGSSTDKNGFWIHNNAIFQGAAYVVTDFREENGAVMQGPVVANQLYFEQYAASAKWVPIWAMIEGTPSDTVETTVVQVEESFAG